MTQHNQKQISIKEKELETFCTTMDKIKKQFIENTGEFSAKWYEDTAKIYLMKYADISLKLSTHRFVDLKTKVKKLIAESKQISEKALYQPDIWWHEKPKLHTAISQYEQLGNQQIGNKYPEIIDKAVRNALGKLGVVLEEFGFQVTTIFTYGTYQEFWYQKDEEKIICPYYPHMLEWSKPMQETLEEYNRFYKQALLLLQDIQRIKDEERRKIIMNLWDTTP
jgi:hypothetical protein